MDTSYPAQELLALRKLTRAVGEVVLPQMREYVSTLAPLFRPRSVLGEHIQGTTKEPVKSADQAFKELKDLYEAIGTKPPFNLPRDLQSPLMQMSWSLELTPWEYVHAAKTESGTKAITVRCPFKFVVTYSGYSPQRLRELLASPSRNEDVLQQYVLHYLAMRVVVSRQAGLAKVLDTLHFPLESDRLPGLGDLPITVIRSSISTSLPPDGLVIESTELSGRDAFEEIINVEDVANLRDPFKDRLNEVVKSPEGPKPVTGSA